MEKLLIVTPGTLPVPAVKGGAIETFIQFLIDYNEKQQMFDIMLVTQFDKECMNVPILKYYEPFQIYQHKIRKKSFWKDI